MKRMIYTSFPICLFILCACTDTASLQVTETDNIPPCPLELSFVQGANVSLVSSTPRSRSAVTGTGTGGNEKIAAIGVYITGTEDHAPYKGTGTGRYTYATTATDGSATTATWVCYAGTNTSGTATPIYVSTLQATLNAFHPADATVTPSTGDGNHTIPVAADGIPASQTFDPANTWNCSATDYLFGSATQDAITSVTAAIDMDKLAEKITKTIYMHHALARVEFQIQNDDGKNEDDYNYIKKIELKAASPATPFLTSTGSSSSAMSISNGNLSGLENVGTLSFTVASGATPAQIGSTATTVGYGLVAPISAPDAAVTLSLTLGKQGDTGNDRTLSVTHDAFKTKWEAGYNYTYKLKLNNHILFPVGVEIGERSETVETDHTLDGD
jgi:hypothetical protein